MLHDSAIINEVRKGNIDIDPFDASRIQPSSYDFTLGDTFLFPKVSRVTIHVKEDQKDTFEEIVTDEENGVVIYPHSCCLAVTRERVRFGSTIAGRLEGKSSLGRLFLSIHITAGFFDPGFNGYPTLELVNHNDVPIVIYPGMPIAQMSFFRLEGRPFNLYGKSSGSKYQDQPNVPVPSKYHLNFEERS